MQMNYLWQMLSQFALPDGNYTLELTYQEIEDQDDCNPNRYIYE